MSRLRATGERKEDGGKVVDLEMTRDFMVRGAKPNLGYRNNSEAEIAGDATGASSNGHRFLDRSKVRILLCDSDPKSSQEVLHLLCNCSYQVTSVRSARQVINVLNTQGADIDIILAEVDLPIAKGFKMLKYIARERELRRIPIIMMSAQDEVSVVVKCLRLGAADYLVKPLRTNELLNLWTHMWRRRRMLGLSEKDIFNHDFELALSDPSDANTNSTTLLSDDTDDKPRENAYKEMSNSNQREYEPNASIVEHERNNIVEDAPNIRDCGDQALFSGEIFSCPRKTDLRVAKSSAFLAYVKSSTPTNDSQHSQLDATAAQSEPSHRKERHFAGGDYERCLNRGEQESCSDRHDVVTTVNVREPESTQMAIEFPMVHFSSSSTRKESGNEGQLDVSGAPSVFPLPFYYPGMVEQGVTPPSAHMFQENLNNMHTHGVQPTLLPQYGVVPHYPHMPIAPSFPYNSVGIRLPSGHIPAQNVWSSMTSVPMLEAKSGRTERRAAALVKFRQKRKERCFDKKIRYVNRKRLAETRPRVRGQFVRQGNNADVHFGGLSTGDDNSEEDDDEDQISREIGLLSSPE
ncbi:two-component response regulator-like PRR1 [Typha latifolia]|uniref:two-component response regulator-like PRR1 n=1 Tax=Typha latifolia TaxID=4733 RepID=UPI003C2B7EC1